MLVLPLEASFQAGHPPKYSQELNRFRIFLEKILVLISPKQKQRLLSAAAWQ